MHDVMFDENHYYNITSYHEVQQQCRGFLLLE